MKKLLFVLSTMLSLAISIQAQDIKEAKKLMKDAEKALSNYNLDKMANFAQLDEGIMSIDKALQNAELAATSAGWIVKGQLYGAIIDRDFTMPLKDPNWKKTEYSAGLKAYEAFKIAFDKALKKFEKEDALKGMGETMANINNHGIELYQASEFVRAAEEMSTLLVIHDLLKANGKETFLDDPEKFNTALLLNGFCNLRAGNLDVAEKAYQELIKRDPNEPNSYESLYEINIQKNNEDAALKYLEEGVKKFPNETGLLFAQINYYLKKNKINELIEKLNQAIQLEPQNKSLYSVLGNVYDNLYQDADKSGETAKADEYFEKSKGAFEKALEVDPNYGQAVYSIGQLYYNKAALITQKMNELSDDLSKEGLKKFNDLKKQGDELFMKALPYFKKSESLDPNDINTLIALKEIFARENQFDLSNEFKSRLEKVQGGGKNEPYFKQ